MSVLDALNEYRVVKVALPLQQGGELHLDGVAKATAPPQLEVTFLPDQLRVADLDLDSACRISFDVAGAAKAINAKIISSADEGKLQLEMIESFSHVQKRAYFRVDADLSVSYWLVNEDNPLAKSINTPVNISGGGLRIPVGEPLKEGTEVGLEIVIDVPEARIVECVAQVIRCFNKGESGYQAALSFVDLDEEDQDAIVAYCLAEQRKQLRLKVRMMKNSE